MSLIASIFDRKPKILTSNPPKELETKKSEESSLKINRLRALLMSKETRSLTSSSLLIHFKHQIMELDLENDYLTAFYICQKNPEAIVLFSNEIREKFLKKTSIFSLLPPEKKEVKASETDAITIAVSPQTTSPIGSIDSRGSSLSILDATPPSPLLSALSVSTLAQTTEPLKRTDPITPAISPKKETTPQPLPTSSGEIIKILQIKKKEIKDDEKTAISNLLKTIRFSHEFILKMMVHESFPTNMRPAVEKILINPDPALNLMIQHVHKIDPTLFKTWAQTVAAHISNIDEIKQLKDLHNMKENFCSLINTDDLLKDSAYEFMHTPFAERILKLVYDKKISKEDGIEKLKSCFLKQLAIHKFLGNVHPIHKKYARSFLKNPITRQFIRDLQIKKTSFEEISKTLSVEFNSATITAAFINQFKGKSKLEALEFIQTKHILKSAKKGLEKGCDSTQTLQALNCFFKLSHTKSTYLSQFKEPVLTKVIEIVEETETFDQILTLVKTNMKDKDIQLQLEAFIKNRLKEKSSPLHILIDRFPELSSLFTLDTTTPSKRKIPEIESLLPMAITKLEKNFAEQLLQDACLALGTNDGSCLKKYTTKDLELLPKPLCDLLLSKGFEIIDWDDL